MVILKTIFIYIGLGACWEPIGGVQFGAYTRGLELWKLGTHSHLAGASSGMWVCTHWAGGLLGAYWGPTAGDLNSGHNFGLGVRNHSAGGLIWDLGMHSLRRVPATYLGFGYALTH